VAVNPATNKIYVANGGDLTVIDGATNNTVPLSIGGPVLFPAVDSVTNKVYVANGSNLTVIDGMTNATTNVAGANAGVIAVNSATNRIYVTGNNTVTVISGAK
jgi:DNA-binding beta-propeller fold protein YncE